MNKIVAYFSNGKNIMFTKAVLGLLKTDPNVVYIIDAETGEIIFDKEGGIQ